MKVKFTLFFILLNLLVFCQVDEKSKSKEDIKKKIIGNWIIKNDSENYVYQFYFEGKYGSFYKLEKEQVLSGKIPISSCPPVFIIVKTLFGYKMKWTSLGGSWQSKIKYIDNEKMILKTNGTLVEYQKFKN